MERLYHQLRQRMTIQNVTMIVALLIALSWTWGTVLTLQKNFNYQRQVDELTQQVELDKLKNENLAFEQRYYRSAEYLELSARARLSKARPGEKLVILPDSSKIKDDVNDESEKQLTATETPSNLSQWLHFFFDSQASS